MKNKYPILNKEFYMRDDVERVARDLLGKYLVTYFDDQITSGKIVETEAYAGISDRASHAWNERRTRRTEIMYMEGGTAYVYLIYGIHALFNVVTNCKDVPHAVLIRALEPADGIDKMLKRRGMEKIKFNLTSGPGLLTQALGINTSHTGFSLLTPPMWLEVRNEVPNGNAILSGPRIGVDYAGEDALLHRRFLLKDNPWVSKK